MSSSAATAAAGASSSSSSSSTVSIPQIPDDFPELQSMKPSQLGELLNDEAAFKKFVNE
jgi:hypothetical protein